MKTIRVALIGTGFINGYHARAIRNVGGAEIRVACGLQLDAAEKFAETYGIPEVTTNAMAVARRRDIDLVVLGLPNKFHAPYTIAMLKSGKDVLVEKPMAMNVKEAREMVRVAKAHRRLLAVGQMWRFDTEVNYIRNVVRQGLIGKVVKTKGYGIHVNWGPAGWFTQKKLAGGGALADMGVHAIDTARYIMGDPRPLSVFAVMRTCFGDYDVDDMGVLMINWDNGVVSVVESGWWNPHMDGPEASTQVFGTDGYARLFPTELKLKIGGFPGSFTPPMPSRAEHCDQVIYDRQMSRLLECVRKRNTPSPGADEGLTVMKIVDAAYLSSRTGKAVRLA